MQYESLFIDHQKHSCLPPNCQRAIRAVRQALRDEAVFPQAVALPKALEMTAQAFADLPPEITARAEHEIKFIADFWVHRPYFKQSNPRDYFEMIDTEVHRLDAFPHLALLYVFHRDGRLRQAALHRISPAMLSPFLFAALTTRLNDWVRPVRAEAETCLARIRASETLTHISPAIPSLCLQTKTWRRWKSEREGYTKIEASPAVAAYMAHHLRTSLQGPLARQCYTMLRHESMDAHLPELAKNAATPAVRAAAIRALLYGKTRWPIGQERRWTDKSFGQYRLETQWDTRPVLGAKAPAAALTLMGAQDPAVAVRRIVAYWLLTTDDPYPEVVDILSQDKYPSIRNAMEFYQRKQAEHA